LPETHYSFALQQQNSNTMSAILERTPISKQRSDYTLNHSIITSREMEVLRLIAYEYSSKEIASKLYISYETANSHRKNIMVKLGVKNTAGMVRVGFELGYLHTGAQVILRSA